METLPSQNAQPLRGTPKPGHVFVYGTLRRGGSNDINRLEPRPVWLGRATVRGTLFDLGDYPGLQLGDAGEVAGEIYTLPPGLEALLDDIEEVYPQGKDEYIKRTIWVVPAEPNAPLARPVACLIYEINPRYTLGCRVVVSGDWLAHLATR